MPEPVSLQRGSNDVDPVEVPEVLFISALLETGQFTPERHRISADQLVAYEKVYKFCCDYQATAKQAPDIDLVARRYPDFPYVPNINIAWASKQLAEAAYGRDVRRTTQDVLRKLSAGDVTSIPETIKPLTVAPVSGVVTGIHSFDPANAEADPVRRGIPVPFPSLQEASGGICKAELWLLAARFGVGKTNTATGYAARAAEQGCTVRYLITEMPAWAVNRIINLHFARDNPALQNQLRSGDKAQRLAALEALSGQVAGRVETVDLKATRMTVNVIEELSDGAHLVVVDHVGHLLNKKGVRAIDDWRVMADISADMMTIKNTTEVPILGAVQINRGGETTGMRTPKASQMSQADNLGQDADYVITMARPNKGKVMIHEMDKGRYTPPVRWYSTYDPGTMNFDEITAEQAQAGIEMSKDAYASWAVGS